MAYRKRVWICLCVCVCPCVEADGSYVLRSPSPPPQPFLTPSSSSSFRPPPAPVRCDWASAANHGDVLPMRLLTLLCSEQINEEHISPQGGNLCHFWFLKMDLDEGLREANSCLFNSVWETFKQVSWLFLSLFLTLVLRNVERWKYFRVFESWSFLYNNTLIYRMTIKKTVQK